MATLKGVHLTAAIIKHTCKHCISACYPWNTLVLGPFHIWNEGCGFWLPVLSMVQLQSLCSLAHWPWHL